jgi:hypothetical protein
MKITSMGGRSVRFEYHEPTKGNIIKAEALTLYSGIDIISGDVTYTITLDDTGALVVRPYAGNRLEAVNISPRSGNDIRIWCEMWKPPTEH